MQIDTLCWLTPELDRSLVRLGLFWPKPCSVDRNISGINPANQEGCMLYPTRSGNSGKSGPPNNWVQGILNENFHLRKIMQSFKKIKF